MNNINYKEVGTDGASVLFLDVANNLSLNIKPATLGGGALGLAIWQVWGKNYLKKSLEKLTLASLVKNPASKTESIVEWDAELIMGLKGGIYTTCIYGANLLFTSGDKMNLVDACLLSFGGSAGGAIIRTNFLTKP